MRGEGFVEFGLCVFDGRIDVVGWDAIFAHRVEGEEELRVALDGGDGVACEVEHVVRCGFEIGELNFEMVEVVKAEGKWFMEGEVFVELGFAFGVVVLDALFCEGGAFEVFAFKVLAEDGQREARIEDIVFDFKVVRKVARDCDVLFQHFVERVERNRFELFVHLMSPF